jgi:hypothetical protein
LAHHPRYGLGGVAVGLAEAVTCEETTPFSAGRVEQVLVVMRPVKGDTIVLVQLKECLLDSVLTLEEFENVSIEGDRRKGCRTRGEVTGIRLKAGRYHRLH